MEDLKQVQIIDNGAVQKAEKDLPTLVKEIKSQDSYSNSSWYGLTEKAYQEWLEFKSR